MYRCVYGCVQVCVQVCVQLFVFAGMCTGVLYLSVDNGSHPEAFGGAWHRQHGPQEDEDGQHQGGTAGRHHVVEDDDQVADHLRSGH